MHTDKQNFISISLASDHDYDQYDIHIEIGSKPISYLLHILHPQALLEL